MAEPRSDGERGPVPDGTQGGARRHLRLAVVVTLAVAVVAIGGVVAGGLVANRSAPSSAPSPSSAASSASPPPPLIAVVDAAGGLATMDERGGSRVAYPVPGVAFGFPAWSPDGSRIAAVGQGATDGGVYVFSVRRGGALGSSSSAGAAAPTVIYRSPDHPPFYLYWTPDGRRLTFLTTEGSSIALRIAPADGSAPVDGSGPGSVVRRGAPLYFDWVAADRLLMHVGVGTDAFVGEVDPDGASVQPAVPGTGVFRPASVSADGRYLAYVRSDGSSPDQIVVASRDGSASHQVPVFGPAAFLFDPNGDRLASIAAIEPTPNDSGLPLGPLRLIDAATGSVRTLLDGSVVAFFWAPDGRTIAALRPSQPGDAPVTADTGVVLAAAGLPRPPATGAAEAAGAVARLTFVDVVTGAVRSKRVVRLSDYFVDLLLPYFDQYALSHRLWSPDGSSILLPLVDANGNGRLVIVPADGSGLRPVADGLKGFWSP